MWFPTKIKEIAMAFLMAKFGPEGSFPIGFLGGKRKGPAHILIKISFSKKIYCKGACALVKLFPNYQSNLTLVLKMTNKIKARTSGKIFEAYGFLSFSE